MVKNLREAQVVANDFVKELENDLLMVTVNQHKQQFVDKLQQIRHKRKTTYRKKQSVGSSSMIRQSAQELLEKEEKDSIAHQNQSVMIGARDADKEDLQATASDN